MEVDKLTRLINGWPRFRVPHPESTMAPCSLLTLANLSERMKCFLGEMVIGSPLMVVIMISLN